MTFFLTIEIRFLCIFAEMKNYDAVSKTADKRIGVDFHSLVRLHAISSPVVYNHCLELTVVQYRLSREKHTAANRGFLFNFGYFLASPLFVSH